MVYPCGLCLKGGKSIAFSIKTNFCDPEKVKITIEDKEFIVNFNEKMRIVVTVPAKQEKYEANSIPFNWLDYCHAPTPSFHKNKGFENLEENEFYDSISLNNQSFTKNSEKDVESIQKMIDNIADYQKITMKSINLQSIHEIYEKVSQEYMNIYKNIEKIVDFKAKEYINKSFYGLVTFNGSIINYLLDCLCKINNNYKEKENQKDFLRISLACLEGNKGKIATE